MTMYPFNHIRRNWDRRLALHKEAESLLAEAEMEKDKADSIENDDEYDARIKEINNTIMARFWAICLAESALCYPEPKNEWFRKFVDSFEDGITNISEKQYNVFVRYCEEDRDTWRTGERHCRIANRFITVTAINTRRNVNIRRFNPNA